ncbi:MAG: redoxin domain-containing protein [Candidatus Thermoplasmatota archaeon]|nr:redoxin domain-containing protein [Candidatus Thermoplasmatota archaeon]MBU1940740.1 redoxin domain-containing protein [Candidatus Thermoplasmatota archaeon]
MDTKKTLHVGSKSIDFTLYDQKEKPFTLSEFKGKKIVLSFHPLAWTNVCAQQMQSLETNQKKFDVTNTIAVGISVDSVPSKKAWAHHLNIHTTRLLSDFWPHGAVAQHYEIFRKNAGTSERANIIIDEHQNILFMKIYPISQLPDIQEITTFLEQNKNTKTR